MIFSEKSLYQLGKVVVGAFTRLMVNLDVLWHESVPEGPKIIVPNHPSSTDPFFVGLLSPDPAHIVIFEKAFQVPIFGNYLRKSGHIPVVAGNGRAAFDRAKELLQKGESIIIFPEGSLSPRDGGFCSPRTGAARLALETGAPLVPIGIHLPHKKLKKIGGEITGDRVDGYWMLHGEYYMTVGKSFSLHGNVEDRAFVKASSERIMEQIIQLSQESADRMQKRRVSLSPILSGLQLLRTFRLKSPSSIE